MSYQTTSDNPGAFLPSKLGSLTSTPGGELCIPPLSDHELQEDIELSLVIPTFNEIKNIHRIIHKLTDVLDLALGDKYELIVVDDDSPDKTWEAALQLTATFPKLKVIRRVNERGLSTAVIRGWQAARGRCLGVIDADLQHPPEVISQLIKKIKAGSDLAVGSRNIEGGGVSDWSIFRRIISRGAQLIGLVVLPGVVGRVSDPMSGCFILARDAIAGKRMSPLGYKILLEVIARGKFRTISEVGYIFQERAEGKSKATVNIYLEYIWHLLRLRISTLPFVHSVRFPIRRFARFALVGLSGVFVDMGLLYILSDPSQLGWGLTRSKLIAAEAAIVNNFFWNDLWTFKDLSEHQRGLGQKIKRFLKFHVICSIGLVLNVTLLNIQFNLLGINRYVANAVSIVTVTAWNFWLNLKMSWRVTDASSSIKQPHAMSQPLEIPSLVKWIIKS